MRKYYLECRYDSRKSFYNKAVVEGNTLYSYNTAIVSIVNGKVIPECSVDDISNTTLRHLREFLKQKSFKADTKKQIISDYFS